MDKQQLRKRQIKRLNEFQKKSHKHLEDQILVNNFFDSGMLDGVKSIGVTAALDFEVDNSELIAKCWDMGIDVYLARTHPDKSMDFVFYNYTSKLEKSAFGVLEVADSNAEIKNDLDLVLVPGLAFSKIGHDRVGFGGGFFDRFLARYSTRTCALVNSVMLFEEPAWPIEKTDIQIDHLITPYTN